MANSKESTLQMGPIIVDFNKGEHPLWITNISLENGYLLNFSAKHSTKLGFQGGGFLKRPDGSHAQTYTTPPLATLSELEQKFDMLCEMLAAIGMITDRRTLNFPERCDIDTAIELLASRSDMFDTSSTPFGTRQ